MFIIKQIDENDRNQKKKKTDKHEQNEEEIKFYWNENWRKTMWFYLAHFRQMTISWMDFYGIAIVKSEEEKQNLSNERS